MKLRDKDAFRRLAHSDQRAAESIRRLEGRIEEAMDRWVRQLRDGFDFTAEEEATQLGYMAGKVHRAYGLLLV